MFRSCVLVLACVCGLGISPAPARAQNPEPARKADPTAAILTTLAAEVSLGDKNVSEIPLFELLQDFHKKYQLNFVINETAFKQAGRPNVKEEKPIVAATQLNGLTLHQFLGLVLDGLDATYLVKNNTIEIVPVQHAAKVTRSTLLGADEESGRVRLAEPLVCVILKEKPLNEAVAKIAETYDLSVVVSPQSGDARTGFVSARLLNVPADQALELLAVQCDLRVVRRGNAFLITSRDHSNDLFEEKLDRERRKIEVQKLREAPARPPAPPAPEKPPEKPPEKAPEKPPVVLALPAGVWTFPKGDWSRPNLPVLNPPR
jgi:hypothetical protein